MTKKHPILYSFRRCPYAIRARMALIASGIHFEHRDILLKDKPQAMLQASPKGTVPVLITQDDQVIDESWDIMLWALQQNDPDELLSKISEQHNEIELLLIDNDLVFKPILDTYKYAQRQPESPEVYREQGQAFLQTLNQRLLNYHFLLTKHISIIDLAIMPFIRQFANVDQEWFDALPYPALQKWLHNFLQSSLFEKAMTKHPIWC